MTSESLVGTPPNSYPSPNLYADEALEMLSSDEYKVLSFVVRHTWGWHVWEKSISLTMFLNGYGRFRGVGLSRTTIIKCLSELTRLKFLIAVGKPDADGQLWRLNIDPDMAALENRYHTKKSKHQTTMSPVRAQRGKDKSSQVVCVTDQSTAQTSPDLQHRPEAVYATDTIKDTSQKHLLKTKESTAPIGPDSLSEDKSVEATKVPQTDFAIKAQNDTASPRSDVKQPVKRLPQSAQGGGAHPMRAVIDYGFNGSEGLTGRLSGFFAGTLRDHPQQRAWAQTQPTERPATPQEVVALALWYSRSPDYSRSYAERKGLPKTPSVLRERLDEFRGSVGYDRAMSLAGPILERLLKGERLRPEPVSEVKPAPMPQRVEAAQAYKPISPMRDPAYLDRRQAGDLELAAKLFGA